MNSLLAVWTGFGAVWLATLTALTLVFGIARAREWLQFRAEVRAFERELDVLARRWNL